MKSKPVIVLIIFLAVLLSPAVSPAAVYVGTNFYIGAGITIGCVTIFFAFGVGEHGYYTEKEEELDNFREMVIADGSGMRLDARSYRHDIPVQDGMFRVLTW